MKNHISKHTASLQLTCTDHHIVASVTWGKMVAACTFCNIIKAEIEKLNSIVNSLSLKDENLYNNNSPVELSHITQTVYIDHVNQAVGANDCASFSKTKPYPEKCISSDEIENVDSHVTKEAEVCEMNESPKDTDTLLTIKVEPPPEMLCNAQRPVDMKCSYNNVSNTVYSVDEEGSRGHVCTIVAGVDSNTPDEDPHTTQSCPPGAAQGGVHSGCAWCEDIKAEIAQIQCTDGIEHMESRTRKKLTQSVTGKAASSKIKDETRGNVCKITTGQAENRDIQKSENIPLEMSSELNLNGLEEVLAISSLESTAVTDERPSLQSELPQKASQLTLCDQADLVHNEPEDLKGQRDDINEDKQYLCEICARRFCTPDGLSMHHLIHLVTRSNGEVSGFEESVNEIVSKAQHKWFSQESCPSIPHMRQHEAKSYICQNGNQPKSHYRNHPVKTSYKCDVSGKIFVEKSSLAEHTNIHSGQKPYICTVCGKGVAHKRRLVTHIMIHTGQKPYACEVCDKRFRRGDELTQHKYTHSKERPHKCGLCGKGFNRKSSLITHTRTHIGEKPYKCEECGKGFTTKSGLTIHSSAHTGEKPYECNVCGKGYAAKGDLSRHIRKHTGEKPYPCHLCGKKFSRKSHLSVHNKIHFRDKH